MYYSIIVLWLAALLYFDPRLFRMMHGDVSFLAQVAFLLFVLLLNVFWLYGIYHCIVFVFKIFSRPPIKAVGSQGDPQVAILYATRNDFSEKAILSCVNQIYRNFHVFILDDSTSLIYKNNIDDFGERHRDKVKIVRRSEHVGFKAGNLNNALRNIVVDYPYFAVVDADEIIPDGFLSMLVPYFEIHQDLAFVQANHRQNPEQPSDFARDLSLGIDFHWNIYQPPRNNHGFVIFYGHGALIRRDVWEKVGGFPEIVSEDLAFATRARLIGYRGLFVEDVVCCEDFPETYQQFRIRHEKWVRGVCEYLHREFRPFWVSGKVSVAEKLDVLMSCVSLFLPTLFLVFLLVANAALPLLLAEKRMATAKFFGSEVDLIPAYHLEPLFRDMFTFDFYLITLVGMFAPIFPYLVAALKRPREVLGLLFKSTIPYISLMSVSTCAIILYWLTQKAIFVATGDKDCALNPIRSPRLVERINANHPLVIGLEFTMGLVLVYLAAMTMNFALLGIATCLLLSSVIFYFGWENKLLRRIMFLPLSLVLLVFASMGFDIVGIQGFSMYFLAVHF